MHRTALQRQAESARNYADYSVLDESLNTLVSAAAGALGFDSAMVNILDDTTQYTLARHGFDDDDPYVRARDTTTCTFVLESRKALSVPDSVVSQFSEDDAVSATARTLLAYELRSYLGVPLYGREGVIVGTLCVFDDRPRENTARLETSLAEFGRMVEHYLEAIRNRRRTVGSAGVKIADALHLDEIEPWFQPVVDIDSGRIVAVEALARWQRPNLGMLGPDAFLPAIAGSDLEIDVDHSILQAALRSFGPWLETSPYLNLHVNLSARHLGAPDGVAHLEQIVAQSGVPASAVVFELTETPSLVDRMHAEGFITALHERGFRVVLDDIGIGFSSLERLLEYPVDGFKIDSAIARTLGTTAGDSLIKALAGFASDTGRSLVIEGVETLDQLTAARRNGCTAAQGWYFSAAIRAADIAPLLRERCR